MPTKTYNPKNVKLNVRGIPITHFAPDTMISVEYDEDDFEKVVGATGEVVRVLNLNTSASVTFQLLQSAPENDLLSEIRAADRLGGFPVDPTTLEEVGGTTVIFAKDSWVKKLPKVDYAKSHSPREWVIDCGATESHVGSLP